MAKKKVSGGEVHEIPDDMANQIILLPDILKIWEDLSSLARNEWICWVESANKDETRNKRIKWMLTHLRNGKKRPCNWQGCIHRKKKELEE